MLYLILTILFSCGILALFKYIGLKKIDLLPAIVINYFFATAAGFLIFDTSDISKQVYTAPWLPFAVIVGAAFVLMFFIIGRSTDKAGITPTIVAAKMSMIIPILFSITFFEELITVRKAAGFVLACTAVILSIYQNKKSTTAKYLILPIIIFFGTGCNDSIIKYCQELHIEEDQTSLFSAVLFGVSAIVSFSILILKKSKLNTLFLKQTILVGVALGVTNFGSLYFFIHALRSAPFDSSIIFGLNSISIVCLSTLIGKFLFKEQITHINWIGIALSLLTIYILI